MQYVYHAFGSMYRIRIPIALKVPMPFPAI
jgi:hypothetical protein